MIITRVNIGAGILMEAKKRVTRNQIAERAGVSPAVVSFVLNDSNYVKDSTRERVLKAIRDLEYRPNLVARSLRTKRTNHLTLLGNDLLNPVFAEMAHAMSDVAYARGFFVSVCNASKKENIDLLLQSNVAGVVVASDLFSERELNEIARRDVGVVLFKNREFRGRLDESVIVIEIDLLSAYRKALKEMAEAGRKRILYLSSPKLVGMEDRHLRFRCLRTAAAEIGLPFGENQVIDDLLRDLGKLETALAEKRREVKPDLIVAGNDEFALVAITLLKKMGLRIPEDIAVIGCDNIKSSEYISPSLSTIDIRKESIGASAATALIDRLQGKEVKGKTVLATEWIRRESTG